MGEGDEDEKLSNAIKSGLELATEKGFKQIHSETSLGIFDFPKNKCAKILLNETVNFLLNKKSSPSIIKIVEFCLIDYDTIIEFHLAFNRLKSNITMNK